MLSLQNSSGSSSAKITDWQLLRNRENQLCTSVFSLLKSQQRQTEAVMNEALNKLPKFDHEALKENIEVLHRNVKFFESVQRGEGNILPIPKDKIISEEDKKNHLMPLGTTKEALGMTLQTLQAQLNFLRNFSIQGVFLYSVKDQLKQTKFELTEELKLLRGEIKSIKENLQQLKVVNVKDNI